MAERVSDVDGLAQLSFLVHGLLERRVATHDVSIVAARLLGILRDRTPTMLELTKFLELDKSSVTGLVARAERRGLVRRVPSTTDRRSVRVVLTDDGRSLVGRVSGGFADDVTALLGHLPPEQRAQLAELVSRMLVSYAAERGVDLLATDDAR